MDWKRQAIDDLRKHGQRTESLHSIRERLASIESDKRAIKATSTDTTPVRDGSSRQEDRLLGLVSEQERLKHTYAAAKRLVNLVDKGLSGLEKQERLVLEKFYIYRTKGYMDDLMQELGYEQSHVYNVKDRALHKFTIAMYGLIEY